MADFFRLFSETPALNLIFIIGGLVFVLGVVRKVHTFVELTKAGAIALIAFGLGLMIFSMVATLVGVIPPREVGRQTATTVPESQELESVSPEEPEGDLASDTPNRGGIFTGVGALIVFGLIVLLVILLGIWNSKAGWRFRQSRFGHEPAAYYFTTARRYAIRYASPRTRKETAPYPGVVISHLRRAVSWDATLFEKAENDVAFKKIRETIEYRVFAKDYREVKEEAGEPPND
jgi:hypothetical protein